MEESEHPKAVVIRYVQGVARTAEARGFSPAELREVKMTVQDARRNGIYADIRRRTRKDENVASLREWLKKNPNLSPKRPLTKKKN
jgi:ribosomal protein L13E